jgi:hypothetical protein
MTFAMTCLLRLRARRYDRRFADFFDSPCTDLPPDKGPTRIQLSGRLAVELAGRDLTSKFPGGQARADASLSALLPRLRTALGSQVLDGRGEITLRLPHDAWIDLAAAEDAIHRAEAAVVQRPRRSPRARAARAPGRASSSLIRIALPPRSE